MPVSILSAYEDKFRLSCNYVHVSLNYIDISVCDCILFYPSHPLLAWCSRVSERRWVWIAAGSWYVCHPLPPGWGSG